MDSDIRQDTFFMLILIAVVGLAFTFLTSESGQKYRFVKDCSDTYTTEECERLWSLGNGND